MSTLTSVEANERTDLEAVIERADRVAGAAAIEKGRALTFIRDRRLYRDTHATFEDYCHERWGLTRKRAYDLIGASATVDALSPIGDTPLPVNEAQARELAGLSPGEAAATMRAAHRNTGGKPTAAAVRAARPDRSSSVSTTQERRPDSRGRNQPIHRTPPDQLNRRRDEAVRLWKTGASTKQIAAALDVTTGIVDEDLRQRGVARKQRPKGLDVDPEPYDWRKPRFATTHGYQASITLSIWSAMLRDSRSSHHLDRLAGDAHDAETAGDTAWLDHAAEEFAAIITEATRLRAVITDRGARLRARRNETDEPAPLYVVKGTAS